MGFATSRELQQTTSNVVEDDRWHMVSRSLRYHALSRNQSCQILTILACARTNCSILPIAK